MTIALDKNSRGRTDPCPKPPLSKLLPYQYSKMWGWFGGAAAQKRKDSPKNAILGLRSQLEMLQKREKHIESQRDEQDAVARKNVNSNKSGA